MIDAAPIHVTAAELAAIDPDDWPDGQQFLVTDDENRVYESAGAAGSRVLSPVGWQPPAWWEDALSVEPPEGSTIEYSGGLARWVAPVDEYLVTAGHSSTTNPDLIVAGGSSTTNPDLFTAGGSA